MGLLDLPEDILLNIASTLAIPDVLTLTQTCRVLHAFASTDYLWHRLVEHTELPLDIPADTPTAQLSGEDLQRLAIRAIRLQLNWRRPQTRIARTSSFSTTCDALFDFMHLVPGGRWLLTVQVYSRQFEHRSYSQVCLWSLANVQHPRCVIQFELTGKHRDTALTMPNGGNIATFVVALNDGAHDFIEIRTIAVDESVDVREEMTPPLLVLVSRRLELPPVPDLAPASWLLEAVSVSGTNLVATVARIAAGEDVTSRIMIADTRVGPARWMQTQALQKGRIKLRLVEIIPVLPGSPPRSGDRDADEPRYILRVVRPLAVPQARLQDRRVIVFGRVDEDFVVRIYELPPSILRGRRGESHTIGPRANVSRDLDDGTDIEWGRMLQQLQIPLGTRLVDSIYVPSQFTRSLAVFVVDDREENRPIGRILSFSLDDKAWAAGSAVRSDSVRLPVDTSVRIVGVGATGFRAVWMEYSFETTRSRLMKMELGTNSEGKLEMDHGVLLPSDPPLPFSMDSCRTLAFDEATGRLCLGLLEGGLHVVDFL